MADRGRGRGGGGAGRGRGDFGGGRGRGDFGGNRGRGDFGSGRGRGGFNDHGGGGGRGGRGGFEQARVYGDGRAPAPDAETTNVENSLVPKSDPPAQKKGPVGKKKGAGKQEEKPIEEISTSLSKTSLGPELPQRPGYGIAGKHIVLWTNYFELKGVKPDTTIYRWKVEIQGHGVSAEGDNKLAKPKRKRIIQLLLQKDPFSKAVCASDWAQIVVSTENISLGGERKDFDIEWWPADGEPLPARVAGEEEPPERKAARKRNTFKLLVAKESSVSLGELVKDLTNPANIYPSKLETIQALNIMLGYGPSTDPGIAAAAQNRFYPVQGHANFQSQSLGYGLDALRGYFSSVRTSVNRIIVNVNVATAAFYKAGPLLDLLKEIGGAPRNETDWKKMNSFVRKLRFETNYLPDRSKTAKKAGKPVTKRKVHAIFNLSGLNKNATNTTFDLTDVNGKVAKVTVQAYFRNTYNITLAVPQAPLVNYGTDKDKKWIPVELCTVLPGQLARRLLQGDQTRAMIGFAARRPVDNAESIMNDGLAVTKILPVNQGLNEHLKKFGIQVNANMLTVHGRILPAPALRYRTKNTTPMNGAWNLNPQQLGAQPFLIAKPIGVWNCLVVNAGSFETIRGGVGVVKEHLNNFASTLRSYALAPGPVQNPIMLNINPADLQNRNIAGIKQQIAQTLKDALKEPPKLLFIILPSDNAVLYDAIKTTCDVELGVPNICSIGSKLIKEKGQIQYFSNVALKFNQKLGGVNHSVEDGRLKPLDEETIVFGIDVTHPSPGSSEKSPSIAGVVASVDKLFSQYPAGIRTQEGRKEMVTELGDMIVERLQLWQKRNSGRLPKKVIVYRDGVSEGQYKTVLEEEYPSFVAAFKKLYGDTPKHPKISIIVVGKRHHTRFYPTKMEDTDGKTGNPKPGTVVDRGVTGEKLFDFFLLAHQGLQGTSKPAHYVVLKDENKLGADQLQTLTHNLCYTFARATRSVSLCPPAYYADLLCERGRSYLHGVLKGDGSENFTATHWHGGVHPRLAETMFYL